MPEFRSRTCVVLLDMAGCPNRCRHCWLGNAPNKRVSEETLRWVVKQFREWTRPGEEHSFFESLSVCTWYREPDFAPNYRELWALEQELSDPGKSKRQELLSIWRLARDDGYAQWARDVGTEACQFTFFGLEENTDYFTRRKGAFQDNLLATERLLEVGIRPRWQLFLTERSIPELEAFVGLIHRMQLDERMQAVEQEFQVFVHLPCPDGEAVHLEYLRPSIDALHAIPSYLAEKTMIHFGKNSLEACLGKAEKDWLPELLQDDKPHAEYYEPLAFMVTPGLDVYCNIAELVPWWKLGNLKTDGIDRVLQHFQHDGVPGLHVNFQVPVSQLARMYGRNNSQLMYSRSDLIFWWMHKWGEEQWHAGGHSRFGLMKHLQA